LRLKEPVAGTKSKHPLKGFKVVVVIIIAIFHTLSMKKEKFGLF